MANIKRIELPVSNDIRLTKVEDGSDGGLWVAAGPSVAIGEAVKAGGVHVMTRRGPRVILVDRVVKLSSGLAIVPIEPDFDAATKTTKTNAVEDMTADQLRAALAALEGDKQTSADGQVTSSGKGRGRTAANGNKVTQSKPATVTKSAPAAAAVTEVDDSELDDLLV